MRLRTLAPAMLLVAALAGCGGDSSGSDASASTASSEPAKDGCDAVTAAAGTISLVNFGANIDNATFGDQLKDAHQTFTEGTPPDALAEDWETLTNFFEITSTAFGDVDMKDGEAVGKAQQALAGRGEEFATLVETAPEAGQRVADYAKDECGAKGASTVTDPCTLLDESDLEAVFPERIPEPESSVLGEIMDCGWEIDADDLHADDFLVRVVIVPQEEMSQGHLGKLEPTGTVDDLENGKIYSGSVGAFSGGPKGHTLSFTVGDRAVIIAVAKGNDSTEKEDIAIATSFANIVADQL